MSECPSVAVVMVAIVGLLGTSACTQTPPMPGQAKLYATINTELIAQGVCASQSDCEQKELVFSQAGKGKAYFTLHSASDPHLRAGIRMAVERARSTNHIDYPVVLSFHSESKADELKKVWPSRAAYTDEIR